MADDFGIGDYIEKNFPKGVLVLTPDEASEDDAARDVQRQFTDAGFDCPDDTARGLVRKAWKQASSNKEE